LAGVALVQLVLDLYLLVQFGGDQKGALESHRIVSLDGQGDPLEKIHD